MIGIRITSPITQYLQHRIGRDQPYTIRGGLVHLAIPFRAALLPLTTMRWWQVKKFFGLILTLFMIPAFVLTACGSRLEGTAQESVLVTHEFRYHLPDAEEVLLGWGINGWNALPEDMRSSGTFMQNNVMHTPMQSGENGFVARVQVPEGVTIDYGFLITKDQSGAGMNIWDGDYHTIATANGIVEVQGKIALVANDSPEGKELYLANCSVCHGSQGKGVPGLGKDLTVSDFVNEKSDGELIDFIKAGRAASDPLNTTGIAMPPQGGNAALSDQDLGSIVAYVRTLAGTTPGQIQPDLKVVAGFTIAPYSVLPQKYITSLTFGPDGVLYVCSYDGMVWTLADRDGDGQADKPQLYADGFEKPVGLTWHEQELFVASLGKITALRDQDGDGHPDETREIVTGLPAGIQPVHANNDMTFGPDDRLYFGVGSTSDASPEAHQYAASILSVNPDGSDLRVVATGVRNAYDLAFNMAGDLFATDNGPDGEVASTFPPDELNHIVPGSDYGFPYSFGPPEIGSGTVGPVLVFPVHSAPAGIAFYEADQFPSEYRGDAFVALWSRGQLYRIQFAQTPTGEYAARGSLFASGLPGVVDVTVGPDGHLYVSAATNGTIYRILYNMP